MSKYYYFLFICLLLQACGSSNSEASNDTPDGSDNPEVVEIPTEETLHDQMIAAGWTALSGTADLSAWRGYDMEDIAPGWEAKDGELQFSPGQGNGGDLITKEQYTDFEFQLEYQLIEGGNSGIFYLVNEVEDMPIYYNAPEYQLLDNGWWAKNHDEQAIHFTSANYDLEAPKPAVLHPIGQWNTAKIVKQGKTVSHYLNDQLTVQYELGSPAWTAQYEASKFKDFEGATYAQAESGHLGLQDHGEFVRFRNVFVKGL